MKSTWWRDESELDDQQKAVIRLDIDDSPVLVTGQPGSGKTNLALLRANYIVLSGLPRTVVLTMGRVISNFIYAGAALHGLEEHNVMTFHEWGRKLIAHAGVDLPEETGNYGRDLDSLVAQLRDLAHDDKLEHFDSVILDEAQDYPKGSFRIFTHVTDRLFVTGDENQRINERTTPTLKEFRSIAARVINLDHHYRNGRAICNLAGALRGNNYAATSRYDEEANPSRFERHRCQTLREQVYEAAAMIPNQLAAYPEDLVGIMVLTNDELDEAMQYVDEAGLGDKVQMQSSRHGYARLDPDKPVVALTAYSAKGLEFRSAHFLGVDTFAGWPENTKNRNLAFTAFTRAKTSLDIYHASDLPAWLESPVLQVTSKPTPPSKISTLFPKVSSS